MLAEPMLYARLLGKRLEESGASVYLVNTGWVGGSTQSGAKRISLSYTRAIIDAALSGALNSVPSGHLENLNLNYLIFCSGVPGELLNPSALWKNSDDYDIHAQRLCAMFPENQRQRLPHLPQSILASGTQLP